MVLGLPAVDAIGVLKIPDDLERSIPVDVHRPAVPPERAHHRGTLGERLLRVNCAAQVELTAVVPGDDLIHPVPVGVEHHRIEPVVDVEPERALLEHRPDGAVPTKLLGREAPAERAAAFHLLEQRVPRGGALLVEQLVRPCRRPEGVRPFHRDLPEPLGRLDPIPCLELKELVGTILVLELHMTERPGVVRAPADVISVVDRGRIILDAPHRPGPEAIIPRVVVDIMGLGVDLISIADGVPRSIPLLAHHPGEDIPIPVELSARLVRAVGQLAPDRRILPDLAALGPDGEALRDLLVAMVPDDLGKAVLLGPVLGVIVPVTARDSHELLPVEAEGVALVEMDSISHPFGRDRLRTAVDLAEPFEAEACAQVAIGRPAPVGERERRFHSRATGRHVDGELNLVLPGWIDTSLSGEVTGPRCRQQR
ncbi:MAG: hypothetical protein U0359_18550 [Byssovorax sp.]